MTVIGCNNLSLSFGSETLLEDITLAINEGDKLAVVGVNGAGKTTFLKLICGELEPSSGSIFITKGKTIGKLDQHSALDPDSTVFGAMLAVFSSLTDAERRINSLEAEMRSECHETAQRAAGEYSRLYEEYTRSGGLEYKSRIKSTLNRLGFGDELFELEISGLSGGQKTTLALARLLLEAPDILVLDEPTNHLDLKSTEWLEEHLKKLGCTLIVVSHDRYFLDRVTTQTFEIENKHGTFYSCAFSEYRERKRANREIAEKQYRNQQKEIERLRAYIEQQRRWNRERNIIAAESREKAIDRMIKVEKPSALPSELSFSFAETTSSGNDVLMTDGLSMGFGDNRLFNDVGFEVKKGERFFIIGSNGCGKSTLLKILTGTYIPLGGRFEFGYNCRIGYYDQESQGLDDGNTVFGELWDGTDMKESEARALLAMFMFRGDDVFKEVKVLSGGERARLTLAKLMQRKVNVLILDEPTNHLDINSREALESALGKFDGTVIAVSHDRYFINRLATHILEIIPETHSAIDFIGSYGEFTEKRSLLLPVSMSASGFDREPTASKESYLTMKKARAASSKRIRDTEKTSAEIKRAEERLDEIVRLCETEAASDYVRLTELYNEKSETEEKLLELYEFMDQLTQEQS